MDASPSFTLRARTALLPSGWANDVVLQVERGRIVDVRPADDRAERGRAVGILLPAPANLHSHSFQRAMAGLSERRSPGAVDSFWSWRDLMFRFLDRLGPEEVEAIAALAFMEMLEAGWACVAEFHYLHHAPGGTPYDDPAEMMSRIAAAAERTGIGLTLLPVHYRFGGLDRRGLGPGQIRFGTDSEGFARLVSAAQAVVRDLPEDSVLGVAPHSLRAVSAEGLKDLLSLGIAPVHMHLAETVGEVEEVVAATGARPIGWLLEQAPVGPDWCLVHCTQALPEETLALAATGAVIGLCPLTEANLGDGIFDAVRLAAADGRFGLGSDSCIRISLAEEMRMLETSQRLRDRSRAALATASRSTGRRLWEEAARGGAQAAGRHSGALAPGLWADLVVLDDEHPDLAGLEGDTILDSFAMAGGCGMVADLWSAGRHVVTGGRHVRREAILRTYRAVAGRMRAAL
ncbi:formimidoylglutamate deiminase [Rubellimicrobium sp. CFH 75288]|uniref:formimidoylglutamate deiminase n=1 Tax=Rubellimicrobium sp. CFH 75288 TaxID=2697034 RepID=UPI001412B16F|nr:formimidoylglutamate deiminase [Rubellimicrobium sp. CFH 75288]NAZ35437.1 formimidoylglutamate deiminase [Rubellimicrobium sp. CFH 75288]